MAEYQVMKCKNCKHYEAYHKHPNPLATSTHWCKKCNEEIKYVRVSPISDFRMVWIPKKCYFEGLFEYSDEYKRKLEERYGGAVFCQVED